MKTVIISEQYYDLILILRLHFIFKFFKIYNAKQISFFFLLLFLFFFTILDL